ncbi:sulfatase-like hydrolase/transferase [Sphaerisporangium aureirubrum]|uniref:Sulfatase-like hydrolase/transferase n=1 Tax=Sphaerisporangium aureirubrum TaxID=1544736 RepID=A0ABW1NFI8_9ACTN
MANPLVTVLAFLLLAFALVAPNQLDLLTPGAFLRIPVEGLLGAVLVLVLPGRARRVAAVLAGVVLGLLAILKVFDMGFFTVLDRPFDPLHDWSFVDAAVEFLNGSVGHAGAIGAMAAAALLAVAVLAGMTFSALRLSRVVARHGTAATGTAAVLGAAWVVCTLLGAQIVPGVPVAALASGRLLQIPASLRDQKNFAAELAVDPFRDAPADKLLTALRGKDVVLAFVESYGRSAVADPRYAPKVGAVLSEGTRRLSAAGFSSRSAFLTSPTAGGGSWLAHSTLLSGLWVDNQQRYENLVKTGRLTLNRAFQRADWRTVGVMPGVTRAWPEGKFFGYDQVYSAENLGYRGPRFNWGTMPDQYTLNTFQRTERTKKTRSPVMAEIPLVSSHAPWAPVPTLADWSTVGDGSDFKATGDSPDVVWRDPDRVRNEYRRSIEYSLNTLISYVETYGDDDLVVIFLGDHQPAPIITGPNASRDVPITIIAHDPAVIHQITDWHWQPGMTPGPQAPVWKMNTFRDHFLTTFSPDLHPTHLKAHAAP